MSGLYVGLDIHFTAPAWDVVDTSDPSRPERGMGRCRAAKITGVVDGTTMNIVSFNRSGLYFGHDIANDPDCSEWTWHHLADCKHGGAS